MLKTISKKIAYQLLSTDPEKLYKYIKKYDVVSFDIFDTLVKRNTENPEDVFELVELLGDCNNRDFSKKRVKAEQVARKDATNNEVTLTEIYNKLEGFLPSERYKLMKLETELETNICCAYLPMQKVYNWCKKNKKSIYLISDMYLNTSIISEILYKCDYTHPDRIYISCEYKKNKSSGGLYTEIRKDIKNKTWVHIGDSIKGDFLMAKRYGISSKLIKHDLPCPQFYRNNYFLRKNKTLFKDYLKNFIRNHERKELSEFEKIGYEILGPLLTGFCVWLNKHLSKRCYNSVLFFARDSKIILECYEKLFGNNSNNKYFYISRKAAIVAYLDLISNYQELHDLLLAKDSAIIGDLCNALEINGQNLERFLKESRVNYNLSVNREKKFDEEIVLSNAKKYSNCESENQRNLLLKYLKQENAIDDFAIVDLGWEGRTQWILNKILPNSNIDGYYIGIITKCESFVNSINANSYFGSMKNTDYYARVIMESIALFESLFLTNEGSTIGYKFDKKKNKVIPIQAEPDQTNQNKIKIDQLQSGAIQFINDIRNDEMFLKYKWDSRVILDIYASFAINPKLKTVRLLKTLQFRDNDVSQIGAKHSLPYYFVHPTKLPKDIMKSYYRVLFLKDIFKLPLPYFKVLYAYYQHLHRKTE